MAKRVWACAAPAASSDVAPLAQAGDATQTPAQARARPADFVALGKKLVASSLEQLEGLAVAPEIAQRVALGHQAECPVVCSVHTRRFVDKSLGQTQRFVRVVRLAGVRISVFSAASRAVKGAIG